MPKPHTLSLARRQAPSRRRLLGLSAALGLASVVAGPAFSLASGFSAYSKAAFDQALKGGKPVLVHVHAGWCPICVKQEAVFNELSKTPEFGKLAAFVVDFDREVEFRKTYGVNNQSLVLVFKGGKEVARSGGVTDRDKLAALVADAAK